MPLTRHESPEADLVRRAIQGDTAAFGDLYERYLDPIYRYVYYRVYDAHDAEDMTEIVFLKAWEALSDYRWRDVPFGAWLYRIAHNVVIDRYRASRPELSLDQQWSLPADGHDPEEAAVTKENVATLSRHLLRLDPDYQQVLTLRFISELSHAETGRIMGRSEGAIRILQLRALSSLRDCLTRDKTAA